MSGKVGHVTVEITLWDEDKADAVLAALEKDHRVLAVERIDQ